MFKAIIAVIIGAVILLVVMSNVDKATSSTTTDTTETTTTTESNNLSLTITGEVTKTGTYYVASGGTLGDLITSAGGVTSNADSKAYNLDYILKNNQSFYIAPIYNTSDTCSQTLYTKFNINEATSTELASINGITATIGTSIVSYRTSNGSFTRIEDVKEVSGIGSATFEKIKNYITLK